MKVEELKTIAQFVRHCLETYPETRSSDDLLYLNICRLINPDIMENSFLHVLVNRKYYGIPSFETVRRSRQKVQQEFPELSARRKTKQLRTENEAVFRDFARGALNG